MANQRVKTLLEDLERTLLEFIQKHAVRHDEYRAATNVLVATVKAGEESLLYDVFLEAAATDVGNLGREGSPEAIEGPFYLPNAPRLEPPYVMPQRAEEAGEVLFFQGRVTATGGAPIAEAELDVWQADAAGLYSNIHPGPPDWNLRGRLYSANDGSFEVRTILPPPYEIPKDGPTGTVLSALCRHFFRPAHLHVKVRHPAYGELTSQVYFAGDEYLDSDVASAVRGALVASVSRRADPGAIAARGLREPYFELRYDFILSPKSSRVAAPRLMMLD